jgi:hypothetical protein
MGPSLFSAFPVGAWSEYESSASGLRFKLVMAVAQRVGGDSVIEEQSREATNPRSHRVVMRETYSATSHVGDRPKARAVKVDLFPPMNYPDSEVLSKSDFSLKNVTADNYVRTETVTVRAGQFTTRRHHWKLADGGEVDVWLEDRVAPLGMVKLQVLAVSHDPNEGSVIELVQQGVDAKPLVLDEPGPFDAKAYRAQIMSGFDPPRSAEAVGVNASQGPALHASRSAK